MSTERFIARWNLHGVKIAESPVASQIIIAVTNLISGKTVKFDFIFSV
jgi:hypothetical protein